MAKRSKRIRAIKEQLQPGKYYPVDEAFELLKSFPPAKFTESVDVSINLGVDVRKSDQIVRGSTVLPHGTGKTVRVAVFTQGANATAAVEAGADVVGLEDLADKIKAFFEFFLSFTWKTHQDICCEGNFRHNRPNIVHQQGKLLRIDRPGHSP